MTNTSLVIQEFSSGMPDKSRRGRAHHALQTSLSAPRYPDDPPMLTGRLIVPAWDCSYPPSVDADDLLRVDFDCRDIGPDGLYLLESMNGNQVKWRGCRRFARTISGLEIDQSGRGAWSHLSSVSDFNMRVVGYVEQVYKPV